MLDFAVEVAKGKPIDDDKIEHMRESGFTMDEIWDIGSIAAFFALTLPHLVLVLVAESSTESFK